MFNKNDFINWAKTAQKDNSTMQDFRSSHLNPMKQVERNNINEIAVLAPLALAGARVVGGIAAKQGAKEVVKHVAKETGKDIAKKSARAGATSLAKKVLNKNNNQEDGLQSEGWMQKRIDKRAEASAAQGGHSTERPYNFGDARRKAKADKKAEAEKKAQEQQQQQEGLIGGALKAGLAGAAIYGGVKAGKAIHNKWKAKRATANATNAEDTPSTKEPKTGDGGGKVLGKAVQKAKSAATERIKKDPGARKLATKGLEKGAGLAKKASGWLSRKAAGVAAMGGK